MPEVSVLKAAEIALHETERRLFPIQGHRWLALGLIAFLEQCGRGGLGAPDLRGVDSDRIHEAGGRVASYLSSHVALVMAVVAGGLMLLLALWAVVFWLQSRGTFMYLDNVETGRSDVRRPWHEHAGHAGSYFAWLFGVQVAQLAVILLLLVPLAWGSVTLFRRGMGAAPLAAVTAALLLILVMTFGMLLFAVLLRDFVAPLQWYTGQSCGQALRTFRGLLAAHPSTFVVYVLLKMVYAIVVGIAGMIVSCILCCGLLSCCGLLPTLQIVMQPVFYFERRWSLELLHQLGYGLPDPPLSPSV